ncbi:hypothetical protein LCL95_05010 [Bacillus timonensis]|nr:hypothetical protein [Bacillus timonensis]
MNLGFRPVIGTAWYGRHVVIIRCNALNNSLLSIQTSLHAPTEPTHPNCAETVAQFLSIGYSIVSIVPVGFNEVHYIMTK